MIRLPACSVRMLLVAAVTLGGPCLAQDTSSRVLFEEIAGPSGARIRHTTRSFGSRDKAQVLEMFTAGGAAVAVGDYNNDGFADLFVTESDEGRPNHLLKNNGDLTFTDVAEAAGVAGGNDARSIVSDALWFDYDNDGRSDLLVARFGHPILYHNEGSSSDCCRFKDVTASSGLNKFGNTIAVIAFDYDRDGWLDLLFGNYFRDVNLLDLGSERKVLPNNLDNADNGGGLTLWKNLGGRKFVETTQEAGLARYTGWSLDVGHADLNNDGWQDLYIAGDYGTDRLFINNKNGTFDDRTKQALGGPDMRKGMNVDFGDYDNDGWLDIYVTNITDDYMKECNMLWRNNGDGTLTDVAKVTETCDTDWGWAAKFGDFDNDGWQDLYVVNGLRSAQKGAANNYIGSLLNAILKPGIDFADLSTYPDIGEMTWSGYQVQRLFMNQGGTTFVDMAAQAHVNSDSDGRGIGIADFDNDGLLDFYQSNARQNSQLYRGRGRNGNNWIQLSLEGAGRSNRDAIGARVTVHADGDAFIQEINGGNGYASQSMKRLHFGLGRRRSIASVEILWPDGSKQRIPGEQVRINQLTQIKQGS